MLSVSNTFDISKKKTSCYISENQERNSGMINRERKKISKYKTRYTIIYIYISNKNIPDCVKYYANIDKVPTPLERRSVIFYYWY